MKIPITGIYSRDEYIPDKHGNCIVIMNLEPSFMNGSHWVSCIEQPMKTLNYFDSFGMPYFQEYADRASKLGFKVIYNNQQIQNIKTSTCGYFCLYFLNKMNKGTSYYDLLKPFSLTDTMKNERLIEKYFKNI